MSFLFVQLPTTRSSIRSQDILVLHRVQCVRIPMKKLNSTEAFKANVGQLSELFSLSADLQVRLGRVQVGQSIVKILRLRNGGTNCSFQATV
jgi:hypothetical protein